MAENAYWQGELTNLVLKCSVDEEEMSIYMECLWEIWNQRNKAERKVGEEIQP